MPSKRIWNTPLSHTIYTHTLHSRHFTFCSTQSIIEVVGDKAHVTKNNNNFYLIQDQMIIHYEERGTFKSQNSNTNSNQTS